ncbi:nicotinate phosphoribosyltransferase [Mycoplasma miroungirhinis]|uniref:nicotinate phosphoribosyltransferase n=1 Tax=Mycoplasma miroungirhinis TaxID=754516 RepID=A0A6M4JIP9_9MOLU|nr:nicotinate phosphoribosyltransferase [Mycoplasma miroungirhinis]QJR44351.1 nicotinate phosphoribosyltransferase [Mycoplasma miroungirhinis]
MDILDNSAIYFSKTAKIAKNKLSNKIVTLQFFQRNDNIILCGINEVLDLLATYTNTNNYKIKYIEEGSIINDKEVVLELEGPYWEFGEFEGIIDGILARQSSIATNANRIKNASNKKIVVSMADRADHYRNLLSDGYAISVGGILNHATYASSNFKKEFTWGSMPHALIQMFEGDLVKASKAYLEIFPDDKLTALVDFHNDVITDSLNVLKEFKTDLKAVRVDTSKNMKDNMFSESENEFGVTVKQIKKLRKALDENEGSHVKIIVSSGFNAEKIKEFEDNNAPVDIYGVGAALLKVWVNFSADATKIDGKLCAKAGRKYSVNSKLIEYKKIKVNK